jgi:hypothetical protein
MEFTMTPTNTAVLARLEEKLDHLDIKVEDMNKKLYGNGHPGIIVDQVAQDAKIDKLVGIAAKNEANIAKLADASTPTWIARNWIRIVTLSILVILLVHSFIPEGMTLWQLISLIR